MLFLKVTVCHLPHLQVLPGVTVHWSDHARADGRPSARSGLCPRSLSPASRPLVMCVSHDSLCWSALDPLVFRGSRLSSPMRMRPPPEPSFHGHGPPSLALC